MTRVILILLALSACTKPPEQPDLNTYGMLQPVCILLCRQSQTLTEADGGTAPLTITTTETNTTNAGRS